MPIEFSLIYSLQAQSDREKRQREKEKKRVIEFSHTQRV